MLEKEFQYYLDNQQELVKKYNGKVIVIIGNEVVGVYKNELDALKESQKEYEQGTFLIQKCTPGNEAYTQTFHSRVTFA
jgi:UDP-N-acetylglucosamine 2-epimerase